MKKIEKKLIDDVGSEYSQHWFDRFILETLQLTDRGRFGTKDKIFFFKELSYMLKGGVSMIDAFRVIGSGTSNFAIKEITTSLAQSLLQGFSLSGGMQKLPDLFDQGDIAIVTVGERSGELPMVIKSLAQEYSYLLSIRNKYVGAMVYPIILIIIAFFAVLSLFLLVLPSIFSIADDFPNLVLPWTTRVLRDFSEFLQMQWRFVLGSIVGIIIFAVVYFATESGKRVWYRLILSLPVLGKMTQWYFLIKWARYFRLMLHAGLNYVEIFQLMKEVLHIPMYDDMIDRVLHGLHTGGTIYQVLSKETHIIPTNVSVLIKVGEESASLEESLSNIVEMYEEELEYAITNLSKVIEPVLLIIVGGVIMLIAFGVFGLILEIMEGVSL